MIEQIRVQKLVAVIASRSSRLKERYYNKVIYKLRDRIERTICWLKRFRRIATRYEKTAINDLSMCFLASSMRWLI